MSICRRCLRRRSKSPADSTLALDWLTSLTAETVLPICLVPRDCASVRNLRNLSLALRHDIMRSGLKGSLIQIPVMLRGSVQPCDSDGTIDLKEAKKVRRPF
jgi:hypothetical protein